MSDLHHHAHVFLFLAPRDVVSGRMTDLHCLLAALVTEGHASANVEGTWRLTEDDSSGIGTDLDLVYSAASGRTVTGARNTAVLINVGAVEGKSYHAI